MLEAVFFDYDGVLAPTDKRQFHWFKAWWAENRRGESFPFREHREFMQFYNKECAREGGVQNVYDTLKLPCNMKDMSHPVWLAYHKFNKENPSKLYPGMKRALGVIRRIGNLDQDPLRNRRLFMGINTTNSWKSISGDLEREGCLGYFDGFITKENLKEYQGNGNDEPLKKPSPISLALMLNLSNSISS